MLFIDTLWRFFPLLFRSWPTVVYVQWLQCLGAVSRTAVCSSGGRPRNELQLFSAHERSGVLFCTRLASPQGRLCRPADAAPLRSLPKTCHTLTSSAALCSPQHCIQAQPGKRRVSDTMGMSEVEFKICAVSQRKTVSTVSAFENGTFFCQRTQPLTKCDVLT